MDFLEELITPKEINDYPKHYIGELIDEQNDSFLLYQYAPGLLTSFGAFDYFDRKYDQIRNPLLKFLTDIAGIKNIVESSELSYQEAKKKIQYYTNRNTTMYNKHVHNFGITVLENVRIKQRKDRSLESAILSCAPIVQYAKSTLVKPEMTEDSLFDKYFRSSSIPNLPSKQELGRIIKEYLIANVVDILSNSELFIDPSNGDKRVSDLMELNYATSKEARHAAVYFLLVFLRYVSGFDDWNDILTKVFNLNTVCNKISNGERISIEKAVEVFSEFSELPLL